jgi:O-antigen/teichoic acid export membrane protein
MLHILRNMINADHRRQIRALFSWQPGKLARGTLVMTLGIGLRTVGQAAVFIIVARILGVEAYGAYTAVLALAGTLGCFGGLGIQTIMLRDVSRAPACFASAWGHTLAVICISSPVLIGLYLLTTWAILPSGISWGVVTCIGLAEIVFTPMALAGVNAYQGHEEMGDAAWLVLTPVLSKLAGASALIAIIRLLPQTPPLESWAVLYILTSILAAFYSIYRVNHDLGLPRWPDLKKIFIGLREGLIFAFGGAALKLYADIDKTMLARLANLEAAGLYSAAYRVMEMASIPIIALLTTSLPRFFRSSGQDEQTTSLIPWKLLPAPICYTVFVGLFLYFTAELLPVVLGNSFESAVSAIQWLAWLPLVSLPRLFLQTKLITGNLQRAVVVILFAGSVFNIMLNFLLIPSMNWRGAIISTYAAEVVMGLILYQLDKKHGIII